MGRGMLSRFGREVLEGLQQGLFQRDEPRVGGAQPGGLQPRGAQQAASACVRFVETVPAGDPAEAAAMSAAVDATIESLMARVRAERIHQFLVDPYASIPSALDVAGLADVGDYDLIREAAEYG